MHYLEDLKVGDRFFSRDYEMTLDEIKQFAYQYDPQYFHLDESLAEQNIVFKGLAASGWHTASVAMRLATECFPIAGGLIGSESSVRWPRPTRPKDKVHVEIEITSITLSKTKPDRAMVSYITQAFNHRGDLVLISTSKIVVFSKNSLKN